MNKPFVSLLYDCRDCHRIQDNSNDYQLPISSQYIKSLHYKRCHCLRQRYKMKKYWFRFEISTESKSIRNSSRSIKRELVYFFLKDYYASRHWILRTNYLQKRKFSVKSNLAMTLTLNFLTLKSSVSQDAQQKLGQLTLTICIPLTFSIYRQSIHSSSAANQEVHSRSEQVFGSGGQSDVSRRERRSDLDRQFYLESPMNHSVDFNFEP